MASTSVAPAQVARAVHQELAVPQRDPGALQATLAEADGVAVEERQQDLRGDGVARGHVLRPVAGEEREHAGGQGELVVAGEAGERAASGLVEVAGEQVGRGVLAQVRHVGHAVDQECLELLGDELLVEAGRELQRALRERRIHDV
jgi:hypothetical protein